jgi:hypothetical protein
VFQGPKENRPTDKQYNGQEKTEQKTNNDQQTLHRKQNIEHHESY